MTKSEQMARVRTRNTKPELRLRQSLSSRGVRYRLHRKDLPGKPDVYIARLRLAVFVNGCFWHGHKCSRGKSPATNADFWDAKIRRNQERDARVLAKLDEQGISAITIWQCDMGSVDGFAQGIASQWMAAK